MILTNEIIMDNSLMRSVYTFVSQNLSFDSKEEEIELRAKDFIDEIDFSMFKTTSDDFVNTLNSVSFYDISLFDIKKINDNLFEEMSLLDKFKEALIKVLNKTGNILRTYVSQPLKRRVSPSLSAYKYVGNNKLDIKHSDKSYGLLFD